MSKMTKKQRKALRKSMQELGIAPKPVVRKFSEAAGPVCAAVAQALETIEPYRGDARVATLARDLEGKRAAWNQVAPTDALADTLGEIRKASAVVAADDLIGREAVSKAAAPAELAYLRQMSPAAAAAWESANEVARVA
jgi:hypothetical protein